MKVLLIDIDTLNPDHLGCHGYGRSTSPAIDALADEGILFERAYASESPCGPARAALFSGRHGIANGVVTHSGRGMQIRDALPFEAGEHVRAHQPMLAELLNWSGRNPVTFSTFAERHRMWWFTAGWAEVHNRLPGRCGQERADEVNAVVLPWLERHLDSDWFLHVHYWDPHRNYRCPPEYLDLVRDGPRPAWPDEQTIQRHHRECHGPFSPWGLYPWGRSDLMPKVMEGRADFDQYIDGYDASIRYCDDHLGALFQFLRDAGIWDEVLVILTSDHGEQLGGGGIYGDHTSTHDQAHRVPLIVRVGPDYGGPPIPLEPGSRCDAFVLGLDLAPTIAQAMGLDVPGGWHGQSLLPWLADPSLSGRDHLVLTHGLYTAQRAVTDGTWKLVRTYHPGLFGLPPLQLVHLPSDPHEIGEVSAEYPEQVARLDALLKSYVSRHLDGTGLEDPLQWIIEDGPYKHVGREEWNVRLAAAGRPLVSI